MGDQSKHSSPHSEKKKNLLYTEGLSKRSKIRDFIVAQTHVISSMTHPALLSFRF